MPDPKITISKIEDNIYSLISWWQNTTNNHKVQLRAKLRRLPKSVGFILAKYAKYVMATHPKVVEVFQAGTERCVPPFSPHTGILFSPALTVTMVLFSSGHFSTVAVDVNRDAQRAAGTEEWSVSPPTESVTLSYHLTATPPQRQLHGRSRQVTESCYNITHLCSSEVNTCSHIFV